MEKVIITADEAEGLLPDKKLIHNFVNPGTNLLVGCDFDRADAIEAFKRAVQIELGGEECKRMRHPIAVWKTKRDVSFFEADMAKVAALEAARSNHS